MTEYKLQVNLPVDVGKLIEEIAGRRLMSRSAYLERDGICITRVPNGRVV